MNIHITTSNQFKLITGSAVLWLITTVLSLLPGAYNDSYSTAPEFVEPVVTKKVAKPSGSRAVIQENEFKMLGNFLIVQ